MPAVEKSPKAGALDPLAIIRAFHRHDAAHFVKSRAHTVADSVTQSLSFSSVLRGFPALAAYLASQAVAFRQIWVVRRDNCCAVVIVASIENQTYGIPNPLGWPDGAQFVQHQDLGFKYRTKNIQFGGFDRGIVGILDLLK